MHPRHYTDKEYQQLVDAIDTLDYFAINKDSMFTLTRFIPSPVWADESFGYSKIQVILGGHESPSVSVQ